MHNTREQSIMDAIVKSLPWHPDDAITSTELLKNCKTSAKPNEFAGLLGTLIQNKRVFCTPFSKLPRKYWRASAAASAVNAEKSIENPGQNHNEKSPAGAANLLDGQPKWSRLNFVELDVLDPEYLFFKNLFAGFSASADAGGINNESIDTFIVKTNPEAMAMFERLARQADHVLDGFDYASISITDIDELPSTKMLFGVDAAAGKDRTAFARAFQELEKVGQQIADQNSANPTELKSDPKFIGATISTIDQDFKLAITNNKTLILFGVTYSPVELTAQQTIALIDFVNSQAKNPLAINKIMQIDTNLKPPFCFSEDESGGFSIIDDNQRHVLCDAFAYDHGITTQDRRESAQQRMEKIAAALNAGWQLV
jgi:hypothetical protein